MSGSGSAILGIHPVTTGKVQMHDVGQFLYSVFLVVLWSTNPCPPNSPIASSSAAVKLQTHEGNIYFGIFLVFLVAYIQKLLTGPRMHDYVTEN
jgi:hypothetical protein